MFQKKPPTPLNMEPVQDLPVKFPMATKPIENFVVTQVEPIAKEQIAESGLTVPPGSKPSILSYGFEFEGILKSNGVLNVSSKITGKIQAKSIYLDVDGEMDGEIESEILTVKGKISGEIRCHDLTIGPKAIVSGNCHYRTINIQRGGKVFGKLSKTN
jgi:cytoskeletal protein CcmA (bactofilin family)